MELLVHGNGTIAQVHGIFIVLIRDIHDFTCRSLMLHCLNIFSTWQNQFIKMANETKAHS